MKDMNAAKMGAYGGKTMMAKGGAVAKKAAAKKPAVAIMIAVGKPKEKMAKGGMAKKGYK